MQVKSLYLFGSGVTEDFNKLDSTLPIANKTKIIGLRNILVQDYDIITPETIWQIVTTYLPILKSETVTIINNSDE